MLRDEFIHLNYKYKASEREKEADFLEKYSLPIVDEERSSEDGQEPGEYGASYVESR